MWKGSFVRESKSVDPLSSTIILVSFSSLFWFYSLLQSYNALVSFQQQPAAVFSRKQDCNKLYGVIICLCSVYSTARNGQKISECRLKCAFVSSNSYDLLSTFMLPRGWLSDLSSTAKLKLYGFELHYRYSNALRMPKSSVFYSFVLEGVMNTAASRGPYQE